MRLHVIILAAGQGTRMRSSLPKVLHPLAGRPMLAHVLNVAKALAPEAIHVVIGHGAERVREMFAEHAIHWVMQAQQLGTGHAVLQAMPHVSDDAQVLVLYGDVPLIRASTCQHLLDALQQTDLALLSVDLPDPKGYGRILRDASGRVLGIREDKDCTPEERRIHEGNTGLMAAKAIPLRQWLGALSANNAQGEYYLTDVVGMAAQEGEVVAQRVADVHEVSGVNSRAQLAALERVYQAHQARVLMDEGVSLADPARLDVRGRVHAARDVFIDVNVVLEGEVHLSPGVRIGAGCVLKDVQLGENVEIRPYSVLEGAKIAADGIIGPFARIRPGSELAQGVHIGNFVEIKASQVGAGSKVNHLSYVGDSEIGRACNLGAGTITCNYDGANKHRTLIGDDVFVGSATQLVAPVRVGSGATIGAGSTITKDVEADVLALSRAPQVQRKGWQRPRKKV